MFSDFRYVVRSLVRTRGFTLITIFTLALGIGSAAAIFSVVDWILFRSTAYPADLVFVGAKDKQNPFILVRMDMHLRAYEEQTNVFSEWGRAARLPGNVVLNGEPVTTNVLAVSANLMSMLGVSPALGRGFLPGEDTEGRNQVIVISHQFWQRHFGAAADVLGCEIEVNQAVCTIVGVMRRNQVVPPYFFTDVIQPVAVRINPVMPWDPMFFAVGRLRPGVTPAQAETALAGAKVDLSPELAPYFADQTPVISTVADAQNLYRPEIYWVLLGAVGFLYGIACLNATNLMLVRMLGRKRELSIRLAYLDAPRRIEAEVHFLQVLKRAYIIEPEPRLALLRRVLADGTPIKVKIEHCAPDFGEVSGMILKRGRWLNATSGQEVMINEAFARLRYGEEDPVGQLLKPVNADSSWAGWVIAGVVGDVRENVRTAPGYHIYGPETWYPPAMNTFILRLNVEPNAVLLGAIRRALYELDPKIVASMVASLNETRDDQIRLERFALSVLKVLSGLAITLTIVGLFSVLAYTVDRRMSEFGLRLALGATSRNLIELVVRRGLILAVAGIVVGIAGALALTRYLQIMLFETPPYDPFVLGVVAGLLLVAAVLACALPALRATRSDVARLLRAE